MNVNQQFLGIIMIAALTVVGGLWIANYRSNSVGAVTQVKSAINEAVSYEHRSTVTIALATVKNDSTITITDAAGNTVNYDLTGPVTINGQTALTATMGPDGTTTIPGVAATSVAVVTPNSTLTLNLSPLSISP